MAAPLASDAGASFARSAMLRLSFSGDSLTLSLALFCALTCHARRPNRAKLNPTPSNKNALRFKVLNDFSKFLMMVLNVDKGFFVFLSENAAPCPDLFFDPKFP